VCLFEPTGNFLKRETEKEEPSFVPIIN
jgi:hypothetical protein